MIDQALAGGCAPACDQIEPRPPPKIVVRFRSRSRWGTLRCIRRSGADREIAGLAIPAGPVPFVAACSLAKHRENPPTARPALVPPTSTATARTFESERF